MRNLIKIIVVLNCATWLFAQNGSISGTVSDANGNPLAGANISVEGTSMGAATLTSGGYSISGVPAGSYTITASYIGYEHQVKVWTLVQDQLKLISLLLQAH